MLETIITSSVLIVVLILLRYFFKGKISLRLQYALWLWWLSGCLYRFPYLTVP